MTCPYSRWEDMYRNGVLFVGGPLDGKRMAIETVGDRYYVQIPRLQQAWAYGALQAIPRPEDVVPIETAVYMRTEVGAGVDQYQKQRHVLYVYAGVQGRRPCAGEQIVFRGVAYRIATKHYDGSVRCAAQHCNTSILVAEKDLHYYWPTEMWAIRDGASVEVRNKYQETAP